jgi:hypothetical protein
MAVDEERTGVLTKPDAIEAAEKDELDSIQ